MSEDFSWRDKVLESYLRRNCRTSYLPINTRLSIPSLRRCEKKINGLSIITPPPDKSLCVVLTINTTRKRAEEMFQLGPKFSPPDSRVPYTKVITDTEFIIIRETKSDRWTKIRNTSPCFPASATNRTCPKIIPPREIFNGLKKCLIQKNYPLNFIYNLIHNKFHYPNHNSTISYHGWMI